MSEMTTAGVAKIAGKEIIVRELSVKEIRSLMDKVESDFVSAGLFSDLRLTDIPAFTSLKEDEIDDLLPSQIRSLIGSIRERNPDFFAMLARLEKVRAVS